MCARRKTCWPAFLQYLGRPFSDGAPGTADNRAEMLPTPDGKFDFTGYIADETMEGLVDKYGLESVTCKAGSLLLMKINIVHGSSINMSPLRRLTCYLNVCPVDNHPDPAQPRRRPWFCERRPCLFLSRVVRACASASE